MGDLSSTAFAIGLVGCAYIAIGYPLILSLLARWRPHPVRKSFSGQTVSVILPVRNGASWVERKISSILELNYPRELVQILVVSDGSTDGTDEVVKRFRDRGVELLQIERSSKADALNAAMDRATGEVFFFTDARQPLHPDCLRNLIGCLGDSRVGAACGQVEFLSGEDRAHIGLYWRYEMWVRRNLSRYDSLLAGTCLYVVRRELTRRVPSGTLLDDSWLPLSAVLMGYRFVLEERAMAYEYPNSLESEFLRKVRTLAGIYQLVHRCPALLTSKNRMRWHFVSYRLGRLVMPFLLIVTIASSFALPPTWKVIMLSVWSMAGAAAILDVVTPAGFKAKRVTSAVRSFVVLMFASLCAVSIAWLPPDALWTDAWKSPEPALTGGDNGIH